MSRTIRVSLALFIAAASISLTAVGGATAQGVTPDQLVAAGWTCFPDPNPAARRTVCSDPGHGRPVPGGPPSYNLKLFNLDDGSFIGTSHLIRADLYSGQPCPPTGAPYFFIVPIGYYRCEHF